VQAWRSARSVYVRNIKEHILGYYELADLRDDPEQLAHSIHTLLDDRDMCWILEKDDYAKVLTLFDLCRSMQHTLYSMLMRQYSGFTPLSPGQ
jgi:hypothetical protein